MSLAELISIAESGRDLSIEQMRQAVLAMMEGMVPAEQVAALLAALHRKGESVTEIVGAAQALREKMTTIRSRHPRLLDVVGTGGDQSSTFNISTAAALVAAAAGVPVAKHGNRGFTSRSGSADVLAQLGVNIEADVPTVERCLDELGICFCFAPLLHQAMKHVAPVRRSLPFPTVFNIIGPLANPANAQVQLLGVGRPELRPMLAQALQMLGIERAVVVHGSDRLDEVSLSGSTLVSVVTSDGIQDLEWTPEQFGLAPVDRAELVVNSPAESAQIIRNILAGKPGPQRDVVLANAAAALWVFGRASTLAECTRLAAEAIDSGKAAELLERLVRVSHGRD